MNSITGSVVSVGNASNIDMLLSTRRSVLSLISVGTKIQLMMKKTVVLMMVINSYLL